MNKPLLLNMDQVALRLGRSMLNELALEEQIRQLRAELEDLREQTLPVMADNKTGEAR